jgi:hypothetical protein
MNSWVQEVGEEGFWLLIIFLETEPFMEKLFNVLQTGEYIQMQGQENGQDDQEMVQDDPGRRSPGRRESDDYKDRNDRHERDRDYQRGGRDEDDRDRRSERREGRHDRRRFEHVPKGHEGQRYQDRHDDRRKRGDNNERGGFNGRGRGRGGLRSGFARRVQAMGAQKVLVIESIPEDSCNEEAIRAYFSGFGTIVSLSVDTFHKSALLEYSTSQEAKACHSSPDVIFNNRFVKVFWSDSEQPPVRPQTQATPPSAEILSANLERMQEKKREAVLLALEKQKQLAEIQKTRQVLISQRMEEQAATMEKLRSPELSVQERAIMMKQLEVLQSMIKTLMNDAQTNSAAAATQPFGATAFKPRGSFRPPYRPAYRPPRPHMSERQYVLSETMTHEAEYSERLQKLQEIEAAVIQFPNKRSLNSQM